MLGKEKGTKLGEKGMSPPQVSKDKPHRNHLTDKPPRVFSPDQSKRFRGRIASNSPTSITHTQTSPCCVQLSASTRYPLSAPLAFNGKKKDKKENGQDRHVPIPPVLNNSLSRTGFSPCSLGFRPSCCFVQGRCSSSHYSRTPIHRLPWR